MSKLNTLLKENHDLKKELSDLVAIVRENDAKHKGFKSIQYLFLLSESLSEVSERTLFFTEQIFNIDKAVLFIREGAFAMANSCVNIGERVFVVNREPFNYTFLEKRPYSGSDVNIIHSYFRVINNRDDESSSFVLVPIQDGTDIVGALGFYSEDEERFKSESNFDFISELAVIITISLIKMNNSFLLEMRAQTDYLTSLPNKSMMEITAERWLNRYRLNNIPFIFAILDLDNFKNANDVLGHIVGDDILKQVSRAIRDVIRSSDILGRYGGDEFYLFAECKNLDIMQQRIEQSLIDISDGLGLEKRIGVSVGVVIIPDDCNEDINFMDVVKLADTRMYKVKKQGKGGFLGVPDDNRQV